MTRITIDIAQKELPELIEDVMLGGHILIMRDKTAVAEIIPVSGPKHAPVFGSARGMIDMAENFDSPLTDFDEYLK